MTTSMTRRYGRCAGGRRIHEATPGGHWKILTILSAMSTRGLIATMTIEEPTDADFSRLCPACTLPGAAVRRRRGDGQSLLAQSRGRAHLDRKPRCQADLLTVLLARSKPDRKGLGQTQTIASLHQSTHPRSPRSSHHRPTPTNHRARCSSLVQARFGTTER